MVYDVALVLFILKLLATYLYDMDFINHGTKNTFDIMRIIVVEYKLGLILTLTIVNIILSILIFVLRKDINNTELTTAKSYTLAFLTSLRLIISAYHLCVYMHSKKKKQIKISNEMKQVSLYETYKFGRTVRKAIGEHDLGKILVILEDLNLKKAKEIVKDIELSPNTEDQIIYYMDLYSDIKQQIDYYNNIAKVTNMHQIDLENFTLDQLDINQFPEEYRNEANVSINKINRYSLLFQQQHKQLNTIYGIMFKE